MSVMEHSGTIASLKKQVRENITTLLKRLSLGDKERRTRYVTQNLCSLQVYKEAKSILYYASLSDEVETFGLMRQAQVDQKRIALPRLNGDALDVYWVTDIDNDLEISRWGIAQPRSDCEKADISDIDLILVPAVAFDREKNRLGRGKGYYDRFLAAVPSTIPRIGLCFSCQVVDQLPHDSRDQKVSGVVTDNEVL